MPGLGRGCSGQFAGAEAIADECHHVDGTFHRDHRVGSDRLMAAAIWNVDADARARNDLYWLGLLARGIVNTSYRYMNQTWAER